jgi:hypothetical protein
VAVPACCAAAWVAAEAGAATVNRDAAAIAAPAAKVPTKVLMFSMIRSSRFAFFELFLDEICLCR